VLEFEDLRNAMNEFGVQIRRPPFLEDKQMNKYTIEKPYGNRPVEVKNRNIEKEEFLKWVNENNVKNEGGEEDYNE
jgi:hypothetical protein